jgi:hypothetical protein
MIVPWFISRIGLWNVLLNHNCAFSLILFKKNFIKGKSFLVRKSKEENNKMPKEQIQISFKAPTQKRLQVPTQAKTKISNLPKANEKRHQNNS